MPRLRPLLLAAFCALCAWACAETSTALAARGHGRRSARCAKPAGSRTGHRRASRHRASRRRARHPERRGSCPAGRRRAPRSRSVHRRLRKAAARHRPSLHRSPAIANGARCPDTTLTPDARNLVLIRSATLCLVNRERAAHGERALEQNPHLERAAQGHTDSMAFDGYFDHVGPLGETPLSRMRSAGYIYSSQIGYEVGENIAWGSGWQATPRVIVAAWMASPEHRANILDPRFRDTAIGVAPDLPSSLAHGQSGAVYTEDFGVIVLA